MFGKYNFSPVYGITYMQIITKSHIFHQRVIDDISCIFKEKEDNAEKYVFNHSL